MHLQILRLPRVELRCKLQGKLYHRAYFSVQYCALCAVLMEKCAVLNAKMCSIEI